MPASPTSQWFRPSPNRGSKTGLAAVCSAFLIALSFAADADGKGAKRGKPHTVDTAITAGPAAGSVIDNPTPSFGFAATVAGSSFQCRVDSASFTSCSSPHSTAPLADGSHTVSVRAVDPSGTVDNSPASRTFGVSTAVSEPPPSDPAEGAFPTTWSRFASFETDLNAGTDYGWRIDSPFSVARTSEVGGSDGSSAVKIVTNGGNSSCSCPRMTFDRLALSAGSEAWIGGSWRVAEPSKLRWSRFMNIGHFEASTDPDNWYLGLMVRDSGMEVVARRYDTDAGQSVLMSPRAIPQDRWFDVDIHLRLSPTDGRALTEVYVDGQRVASTTARNMIGPGPLTFYNAGLPYFWSGNGGTTVYFDEPRLSG